MSDAVTKAILNEDLVALRKALALDASAASRPSPAGTLPLQLARDKGRVDLEVALMRAGAAGSRRSSAELLHDYVRELSSDFYMAGWMGGIEEELWRVAIEGKPLEHDNLTSLSQDKRDDIKHLSDDCGGWWAWLENDREPRFYTLSEWRAIVRRQIA